MASRRKEKRTDRSKLDATPPWETRIRDEPSPTEGPYDERDAPEDDITRVDLGALRVPVGPGIDVRLEMNEAQQVIVGAVATDHAKAAPFEQALRDVVVVRGNEPLPAREPVPLRLPKELNPQDGDGDGEEHEA